MIARLSTRLALAAATLFLAACGTPLKTDPARTGPFYTPANVQAVPKLPETVRRIALLPCAPADPSLTENTLADLDRILAIALTRSARAEITVIDPVALARLAKRPRTLSSAVLPADFLARIRAETGADAIILVDITAHSAYPPLVLGLRARLIDSENGAPLWNFDNIVAATSPSVVNSARAHILGRTSAPKTPGDLSYSILQNPSAYADFVAETTWATLPPR